MGRTIPPYRIAANREIDQMQRFKKFLRPGEDQAIFEDLLNECKIYASAASTMTSITPEFPMIISMLFSHHKKLWQLEKRIIQAGLLPEDSKLGQ